MQLAYIILRGDSEESFFSYGYNDKKSKVLYSAAKDKIPNAIILTCFKKYFHEIMNERQHNEESSGVLFYLPSTTDRKETINQYRDNVNFNLVDCILEFLISFSPDKIDFKPHLLNLVVAELRNAQIKMLYNIFRQMAETSNVNLIQNVDYLLVSHEQDKSKFFWVGLTKQRYDTTKFRLTY